MYKIDTPLVMGTFVQDRRYHPSNNGVTHTVVDSFMLDTGKPPGNEIALHVMECYFTAPLQPDRRTVVGSLKRHALQEDRSSLLSV